MTDVCVVGLGHVGLPTAALLADAGLSVVGVDTDPAVVARVNAGDPGFREPGLAELLARVVAAGRLVARGAPVAAAAHLIAVPTPLGADRRADLAAVWAAAEALRPLLRAGDLLVLESTVPVGTTEALAARLGVAGLHVAHVPERALPGDALRELVANDRIVGGLDAISTARAGALYRRFARGALLAAEARTAECAKLAENAYRDVNIAFANELAALCAASGVDAQAAIALANRHPRVNILAPGIGVGGHCVPVDPWFLAEAGPAPLISAARAVNDAVPARVAARIRGAAAGLPTPRIACLGLAYKPNVDDLRESPAVAVVRELAGDGFSVDVAEPGVDALPAALHGLPGVTLRDAEAALATAEVVAVLVAHAAFRALDRGLFEGKRVVDAAGVFGA